ncbi:uncharacterized protein LOC114461451 isoform X2 [Gouania willdenowi]|uniref:uncharacterized protein LOC114461451 isoform X2 n=1 Tax=Gouania willdenowi TaxID=441366 RepID=UPI001056C0F3|nr:uncharacterized protein LOC114461451 isoform X2 [Gouania willdenowi]
MNGPQCCASRCRNRLRDHCHHFSVTSEENFKKVNKMSPHIMLSYQWDDQALVKKIYDRLRDDGLMVWMDIEGGVTGNINDAMAAGVEEAAVICPFMTPSYQASRNCKKELNYADTREVTIIPVMLADNWEASEWLGLITAGLLWVDFRRAEEDEEQFDLCVRSLEEEILFNAGHLLTVRKPSDEDEDAAEVKKKKKPGRGFLHALTQLYIQDTEEQTEPVEGSRVPVQLSESSTVGCYWEEIKGKGCKYYRNVFTRRYLGFDPTEDTLHCDPRPSESEEWLLLMDQSEKSHHRAVIIRHKQSGSFLAVSNGCCRGLTSYDEDCKWFLK